MRAVSVLMLGIVLLLAGLAASWAQDVVAPWVNAGEAQIGGTVTVEGGRDYRVVTSGPLRPRIEQVECTITPAEGRPFSVLGGQGVNADDRLGVSRVVGFEAPPGAVDVMCADRISEDRAAGRFQVVAADGPVSIAVLVAFGLGTLLLVAGLLGLFVAYRRAPG